MTSGQLWESGHSQIHLELAEARNLILQADNRKETDAWYQALRAARSAGKSIEDQLLTKVNGKEEDVKRLLSDV